MQAQYFTRVGFVIYGGMVFMAGATCLIGFQIFWDLASIPDVPAFFRLIGDQRTSALLPTAVAAIAMATLSAWAAEVRPTGPGTGKATFVHALCTIAKAAPLVFGAFPRWVMGDLSGELLDVALILFALFALDLGNWILPRFEAKPSTEAPRIPLPTCTLSASPPAVAAGGSTTLTWASSNAVSAEIIGVGIVPVNGSITLPLTATRNFKLRVNNTAGNAEADVTVTVA